MEIDFSLMGKAFDSDGNEIKLAPGEMIVCGENTCKIISVDEKFKSVRFVYRPPNYDGPHAIDAKIENVRDLFDPNYQSPTSS